MLIANARRRFRNAPRGFKQQRWSLAPPVLDAAQCPIKFGLGEQHPASVFRQSCDDLRASRPQRPAPRPKCGEPFFDRQRRPFRLSFVQPLGRFMHIGGVSGREPVGRAAAGVRCEEKISHNDRSL